jgi:inorganic pyrophosphatase/exopolyphosphatase
MRMKGFLTAALSIARRGPPHHPPDAAGSTSLADVSITACIGNQAADADSIISSICMSYLRQQQYDSEQGADTTTRKKAFVPVMPISRKDLVLRRDVEVLLQFANIAPTELICLDECNFVTWKQHADLKFILMDHNQLTHDISKQLSLEDCDDSGIVEEIIDHHRDSGAHAYCRGARRNIAFDNNTGLATAGSTCTLVHEYYSAHNSDLLSEDVAVLLMGVIVLDTINMDPLVAKGTPRDEKALNDLSNRVMMIDKTMLYQLLSGCKTDLSFWLSLSAADAMRLDYKEFFADRSKTKFKVGMSAVLLPIARFFEKADMLESVGAMFQNSDLDYFVVMTFTNEPAPKREVAVFAKVSTALEKLNSFLLCGEEITPTSSNSSSNSTSSLGSRQFEFSLREDPVFSNSPVSELVWSVYDQGNIKYSRKQFAPLFLEYLNKQ